MSNLVLRLGDRRGDSRDHRYLRLMCKEYALSASTRSRSSPGTTPATGKGLGFLEYRHHLRPIPCLTRGDHKWQHPAVRVDA